MLTYIDDFYFKFFDCDFCLLNPNGSLNVLNRLDDNNVKYEVLGLDFFKNKESSPLYIDLNNLVKEQKDYLYFNYIIDSDNFSLNPIDRKSPIGVIGQTHLKGENLIRKLLDLMKFKNSLFRFYDPRVLIFMKFYIDENSLIKKRLLSISKKGWYVVFNSSIYSLNFDDFSFHKDLNEIKNFRLWYESKNIQNVEPRKFEKLFNQYCRERGSK